MLTSHRLVALSVTFVFVLVGSGAAQERGPAGTVTLTRTEYDRLVDLAARQPDAPDSAPAPAALARADLQLRVEGPIVRGTFALSGDVFTPGLVKVPLMAGGMLTEARSGARPLPVLVEQGMHTAIAGGPAPFAATLSWVAPVSYAPGRGTFVLPVPRAASAVAIVVLPGERTEVQLSRGVVARRTAFDGRTVVDVTLDPGSQTTVSWTSREPVPAPSARERRLLGEVRTLVSIGDADVRLLSVVGVTLVRGEADTIDVLIPAGYELTGATGASLERADESPGRVRLVVRDPAQRRHQFALAFERAHGGGSFTLQARLPSIDGAQRESGEVAVEGAGSIEIGEADSVGLRRVDVRELDRTLLAASRRPLLAGYRYQRASGAAPDLTLPVTRFADAEVLAAVAERAVATTLITTEGRTLTEISLTIRNRAQPFVKVALPEGASIVSVDVGGEPAAPVQGTDGTRVPLLRPGFRPAGPYVVSFVYMHAGTPFARRGDRELGLPRMDLPVSLVEWELFVPDRYRADRFTGNVIEAFEPMTVQAKRIVAHASIAPARPRPRLPLMPGSIGGYVVDSSGGHLPGVTVTARGAAGTASVLTDSEGRYTFAELQSGQLTIVAELTGFHTVHQAVRFDQRAQQVDLVLPVAGTSETVTVQSTSDAVQRAGQASQMEPSANVQSLQRRAAGVLPVRVDVPRAGTSHRFVKPLVIDEETIVRFRYRS